MKLKLLLGLFVITACNHTSEKDYFYFYQYNRENIGEIQKVDTLEKIDSKDSLMISYRFELYGKPHIVRKYTNFINGPVDGDYIKLQVDDYGVVYSSALNWNVYSRYYSSNDSINNIIDVGLDVAFYEESSLTYRNR